MNNYGIIAIFVWSFINVWYKKLCFTGIGQHTLVGFRHDGANAVAHVSPEVKCCTCCHISIFTSKAVVNYSLFTSSTLQSSRQVPVPDVGSLPIALDRQKVDLSYRQEP